MNGRPFSVIAPYYDILMSDVDYEGWVEYIAELLPEYSQKELKILDIACGTGVCAVLFRRAGHDVVALDSSPQMLERARERFRRERAEIEVLEEDMRRFSLPEKVDLVTCLFDSMNNLTEEVDLERCFRCVIDVLTESGSFIFDMNTEYGLSTFWGDRTVVKEECGVTSIWRNKWDNSRKMAVLNLTLFVKEDDNSYKKLDEVHEEKGHSSSTVREVLRRVGFSEVCMYKHLTTERPSRHTGRIMYKARK